MKRTHSISTSNNPRRGECMLLDFFFNLSNSKCKAPILIVLKLLISHVFCVCVETYTWRVFRCLCRCSVEKTSAFLGYSFTICFLSLLCWKMNLYPGLMHSKYISSKSQRPLCIWLYLYSSQLWLASLSLQLKTSPQNNPATPMLDCGNGINQVTCSAWYFPSPNRLLYIFYPTVVF